MSRWCSMLRTACVCLAAGLLAPGVAWAQIAPDWQTSTSDAGAGAVAVDRAYNSYAAGTTLAPNMVLTKVDARGNLVWQRSFTSSGPTISTWVTTDGDDNVIHLGYIAPPMTPPGGSVVLKYSADGTLLWQDVTPSTYGAALRGLADAAGNIYVLSREAKPSDSNADEVVLTKFSPDGLRQWSRTFGVRFPSSQPMAITPDGVIVVSGLADSTGAATLATFDGAGNLVAARSYAGQSELSVAVGPGGEVYGVGGTVGGFLVIKHDAALNPLWSNIYAARGGASWAGVDGSGALVVSGMIDTNTGLSTVVIGDWLTMKIAPSGALLWSRTFGSPGDEAPAALTLGTDGSIYLTGKGSIALTDPATGIVYRRPSTATVKYAADGTELWTGNALPDSQGMGLALSGDGGVVVLGGGVVVVGGPPQTLLRYPQSGLPNQPPVAVASASPTTGTAPLSVSFSSAGSTDIDGSIASYLWTFGDGQTSSAANPTHTYAAGNYTASLTVIDTLGMASTSPLIPITATAIAPPPVPVSLVLASPSVRGGNSTTATVTVSTSAGVTVALSSSNSKVASVPAYVKIPVGSSSARFTVKTSRVSRDTTVSIRATANGTTVSATLTVQAR